MNLKDILISITPDNIKETKLYTDIIDVFCNILEEKAQISKDISKIYESNEQVIKEQFLKTFLSDIYAVFTASQSNKTIIDDINYLNAAAGMTIASADYLQNLLTNINTEHFYTSKGFNQKKGTPLAIEYVYNMIERAQHPDSSGSSFTYIEGANPFEFEVEGSLRKAVYDQIVKPLSHPLGFTYVYTTILKHFLEDIYGIRFQYNNVVCEVRCLTGSNTVYPGANVKDILFLKTDDGTREITKVIFNDDTYLEQYTNPIEVKYHNALGDILVDYTSGHCSLYLTYNVEIVSLTTDEILWRLNTSFTESFWDDGWNSIKVSPTLIIGLFQVGGRDLRMVQDVLTIYSNIKIDNGTEIYMTSADEIIKIQDNFLVGDFIVNQLGNFKVYDSLTITTF